MSGAAALGSALQALFEALGLSRVAVAVIGEDGQLLSQREAEANMRALARPSSSSSSSRAIAAPVPEAQVESLYNWYSAISSLLPVVAAGGVVAVRRLLKGQEPRNRRGRSLSPEQRRAVDEVRELANEQRPQSRADVLRAIENYVQNLNPQLNEGARRHVVNELREERDRAGDEHDDPLGPVPPRQPRRDPPPPPPPPPAPAPAPGAPGGVAGAAQPGADPERPVPVYSVPEPESRVRLAEPFSGGLPPGVRVRNVTKTKSDLLDYYTNMSGNHLKYIVDGNHYEPEVGGEIKGMMKQKLLQEAQEEKDRRLEDALNQDNPLADDKWGATFEINQIGIKPTRKILNRMEQSIFETSHRHDGGLDMISSNPLERNILRAEHYTLMGTPDLDVLVNRSGHQDAMGMIAQARMGRSQARALMHDMYDTGVFNMSNAAPMLTGQHINQSLSNARPDLADSYVSPDDFMAALFRR